MCIRDSLGPFAREAAGQVRVARVEVSADPDREPVVEARVGSHPCAPHEEVAAAVAQDQVRDDLLEARVRLHGGAWGEPALLRDDRQVRLGALVQYCLLYTSDAADDLTRVDLGGRRI